MYHSLEGNPRYAHFCDSRPVLAQASSSVLACMAKASPNCRWFWPQHLPSSSQASRRPTPCVQLTMQVVSRAVALRLSNSEEIFSDSSPA